MVEPIMKAKPFDVGVVTISLDTELGWGRINSVCYDDVARRLDGGREAVRRLLDAFERYNVPATWAIVAQLCRENPPNPPDTGNVPIFSDSADVPWDCDWWHAPNLVREITDSPVDHELGSHSGNHLRYDGCDKETAVRDLDCVGEWCKVGSEPKSFVFPQNAIGHLDILADHSFLCFRGQVPHLGVEPTPTVFLPRKKGELVNVPACVAYRHDEGRNILYRNLPQVLQVTGMKAGVEHAARRGRVFHLVLHPKDFASEDGLMLLSGLESWLEFVACKRDAGEIKVWPMSTVAERAMFR
jgi:hypothetical protein